MSRPGAPRAELISVGSELLLGETVDTNAAFLAGELAALGLDLREVRQLPDDRSRLADAFRLARRDRALVLVTGGLGPTHDDLTREAVAEALGERLELDPGLEATLRERFAALGRMPERNLAQAMLVPSAVALPNPIGSAPGWWVDRDGSVAAIMPGVPSEMRRMWTDQVAPRVRERWRLAPLHRRAVRCFGVGESTAAELLGPLLEGSDPEAGIYARDDGIHVRFSTRGDPAALDPLVAEAVTRLGDDCYGTDATSLPQAALGALAARGVRTLASLEAGTEGALLAVLAGASPAQVAYLGGVLRRRGDPPPARPPVADVVLAVDLDEPDAGGRSAVEVTIGGALGTFERRVRVHGSGPQRLRRGAFAAVDQLRRFASGAPRP